MYLRSTFMVANFLYLALTLASISFALFTSCAWTGINNTVIHRAAKRMFFIEILYFEIIVIFICSLSSYLSKVAQAPFRRYTIPPLLCCLRFRQRSSPFQA